VEHPDQLDLVDCIAEAATRDEAAEAARHTIGGNGAPALDEPPSYAALAALFRPIYGKRWDGKVAEFLGESDRTLRRWRCGQGGPTQRTMATARLHLLDMAVQCLTLIGRPDLAEAAIAHRAAKAPRAFARGWEIHVANRARAKARQEAEERDRAAQWARIAAETRANPRHFVSLARLVSRPPQPPRLA
jgi:hypothetical protein